jgi:16S rRNA (cytosine967-C5)-methyltransferase
VLPEENDEAVADFLARHEGFAATPALDVLDRASFNHLAEAVRLNTHGLQMSPRLTGTDGFYVAELRRNAR